MTDQEFLALLQKHGPALNERLSDDERSEFYRDYRTIVDATSPVDTVAIRQLVWRSPATAKLWENAVRAGKRLVPSAVNVLPDELKEADIHQHFKDAAAFFEPKPLPEPQPASSPTGSSDAE